MPSIRSAIRIRLAELGKTQRWLARESGVHPVTLTQYLGGHGDLLDTSADRLLGALGLAIDGRDRIWLAVHGRISNPADASRVSGVDRSLLWRYVRGLRDIRTETADRILEGLGLEISPAAADRDR